MVSEIKLVIQDTHTILEIINTEVNRFSPSCLIQSLQIFQMSANEALTKLIDENHFSARSISIEDQSEGEEDDDLDDEITVSPTKRKK